MDDSLVINSPEEGLDKNANQPAVYHKYKHLKTKLILSGFDEEDLQNWQTPTPEKNVIEREIGDATNDRKKYEPYVVDPSLHPGFLLARDLED